MFYFVVWNHQQTLKPAINGENNSNAIEKIANNNQDNTKQQLLELIHRSARG
jgi:hypothetical protein